MLRPAGASGAHHAGGAVRSSDCFVDDDVDVDKDSSDGVPAVVVMTANGPTTDEQQQQRQQRPASSPRAKKPKSSKRKGDASTLSSSSSTESVSGAEARLGVPKSNWRASVASSASVFDEAEEDESNSSDDDDVDRTRTTLLDASTTGETSAAATGPASPMRALSVLSPAVATVPYATPPVAMVGGAAATRASAQIASAPESVPIGVLRCRCEVCLCACVRVCVCVCVVCLCLCCVSVCVCVMMMMMMMMMCLSVSVIWSLSVPVSFVYLPVYASPRMLRVFC
jgi:hypothetical protein